MKQKYINLLLISAVFISACSSNSLSYPDNKSLLYGTWNCQFNSEVNIEIDGAIKKSKLFMDVDTTYIRNGSSNSFGTLKIQFPDLPEIEYSYSDSSKWEIRGKYIISKSEEIKIVNLSHPGLDDIINLGDLLPQRISDSEEILRITKAEISLKSESDGEIYNCSRK